MASNASIILDITDKKKENFFRLCHLLVNGGTAIMRAEFDRIHPPGNLPSILATKYSMLNHLHNKKIISLSMWNKLYPASNCYGCSNDFDITLLFVLLRNICNLHPPSSTKSWDKKPPGHDVTREADLARLKYYRNKLIAHVEEASISDRKFHKYWDKVRAILNRMGGAQWKSEVDKMLKAPLSENEKECSTEIQNWYLHDLNIKTKLNELESGQQKIKDEQEKLAHSLSEIQVGQQEIASSVKEIKGIISETQDNKQNQPQLLTKIHVNQEGIKDCHERQALSLSEIKDGQQEIASSVNEIKGIMNECQEDKQNQDQLLTDIHINQQITKVCHERQALSLSEIQVIQQQNAQSVDGIKDGTCFFSQNFIISVIRRIEFVLSNVSFSSYSENFTSFSVTLQSFIKSYASVLLHSTHPVLRFTALPGNLSATLQCVIGQCYFRQGKAHISFSHTIKALSSPLSFYKPLLFDKPPF